MPTRLLCSAVRDCVSRKDLAGLSRAVRVAGPQALASAWPSLSPVERLAAFKTLTLRDARRVCADLDTEGRWLAYLGVPRESLAPLTEGLSVAARRCLRQPTAAERSSLRRSLR